MNALVLAVIITAWLMLTAILVALAAPWGTKIKLPNFSFYRYNSGLVVDVPRSRTLILNWDQGRPRWKVVPRWERRP